MARFCAILPIRHVAESHGLHWGTVREVDGQHSQETLGLMNLSGVGVTVMDEFAIQEGHRYATVIVEPYIKRV